jgi:hypothetical protein
MWVGWMLLGAGQRKHRRRQCVIRLVSAVCTQSLILLSCNRRVENYRLMNDAGAVRMEVSDQSFSPLM